MSGGDWQMLATHASGLLVGLTIGRLWPKTKRRRRCHYDWRGYCDAYEVVGCETGHCAEHCKEFCKCGVGEGVS